VTTSESRALPAPVPEVNPETADTGEGSALPRFRPLSG
jgi:hypothetical protein